MKANIYVKDKYVGTMTTDEVRWPMLPSFASAFTLEATTTETVIEASLSVDTLKITRRLWDTERVELEFSNSTKPRNHLSIPPEHLGIAKQVLIAAGVPFSDA